MLGGVVVGESIIVNVLQRIVAEIPIECAVCTVIVLPARVASLSQVIEKIEQLLLGYRELTRQIDGASLPVGIRDALDTAGICASVIIDVHIFDSRVFELTARLRELASQILETFALVLRERKTECGSRAHIRRLIVGRWVC